MHSYADGYGGMVNRKRDCKSKQLEMRERIPGAKQVTALRQRTRTAREKMPEAALLRTTKIQRRTKTPGIFSGRRAIRHGQTRIRAADRTADRTVPCSLSEIRK